MEQSQSTNQTSEILTSVKTTPQELTPQEQALKVLESPSKPYKLPKTKSIVKKKKHVQEIFVDRSKMEVFLEEWANCNGNGTEAAMKVFNCKNRASAGAIASHYLKQARIHGLVLLEKKGHAFGNLIDMAVARMRDARSPDFVPLFDRLMKIGGYEDFLTKQGVTKATVSVLEVQNDLINEFVEGEVLSEN